MTSSRARDLKHKPKYLPDVNVLMALSNEDHAQFLPANKWFQKIEPDARFVLCPLTEAGFVRLSAAPHVGGRDFNDAVSLLREMKTIPNYDYWPIHEPWLEVVQPLASRLHGYKQVTDAYLLGLAIRQGGVLVTLDAHIAPLAGPELAEHILTLR
jgi:toxin-antitoxin system PIN domain toxin